jgi:hypothetical protein
MLLVMGLVVGMPSLWPVMRTSENGSGSNVESGNSNRLLRADLMGAEAIPDAPILTATRPVSDRATQARVSEAIGNLPLIFEANQGQTDSQVKFLSRGSGYALFLTSTDAVLQLRNPSVKSAIQSQAKPVWGTQSAIIKMKLVGANAAPQVTGREELPGKSNYFRGSDPTKWQANVPNYAKVEYDDVYPGVNLVYYGNQRQLEYDFVVAPGVDPSVITLDFDGADKIEIDAQGDLVLSIAGGRVKQHKPVVYQEVNGTRREISGQYKLLERVSSIRNPMPGEACLADAIRNPQVGFQVAAYDASQPLIIDPVLSYSTYFGGGQGDVGNDIAVDAAGNAYIVGTTASLDFPTTPGAHNTRHSGNLCDDLNTGLDVFVAKFDPSKVGAASLVYSTYLGGDQRDGARGTGIAVDPSGNAYVTGDTFTRCSEPGAVLYPTTPNAFQPQGPGGFDIFVTKLNSTGSQLLYSTFLGGDANGGQDLSYGGIAVDASGNVYVTGETRSSDFPKKNPIISNLDTNDVLDAFVTKLDPSKTGADSLVYSTFLGGRGTDRGFDIAVDGSGNASVTGETSSTDFPTTDGAFDRTCNCTGGFPNNFDAFVTMVNAAGSMFVYSTYLGGSRGEGEFQRGQGGIAIDCTGNIYVTGHTFSTDFPTTDGALDRTCGNDGNCNGGRFLDAFMTKIDPSKMGIASLVYSTYLGPAAVGTAIAVDSSGHAYVTGLTSARDFPIKSAVQPQYGGDGADVFVTKLDPSKMGMASLLFSTFVGGSNTDIGYGIAVYLACSGPAPACKPPSSGGGTANTDVYVTGSTFSTNFPTQNPFQPSNRGNGDAFVFKISDTPTAQFGRSQPNDRHRQNATMGAQSSASEALGKLPLIFEANQGQADSQVKFLSRGAGYGLYLTPTEAVIRLRNPSAKSEIRNPKSEIVTMKFVGANPHPQMAGLDKLRGKSNYLIGGDPKKWRSDIANYARVEYKAIYPGVDLVYYGNQRQLEYDLIVAPGVDPNVIKLDFDGARKIEIDRRGDLVLKLATGELRLRKPEIYQQIGRTRVPVEGKYILRRNIVSGATTNPNPEIRNPKSEISVAFHVGNYDKSRPLIIDPMLNYSSFIGGNDSDEGFAIAVDGAGNAYVTGRTFSARGFPAKNAFMPTGQGSFDAFVTKIDPSKVGPDSLIYSTFLGGNDDDEGFGIAVDGAGNAYVTGRTFSARGFPVVNAFQSQGQGSFDAFVTKLNPAGNAPVYSTFLGGNDSDEGFAIAVDGAGSAYVTGRTFSARGFPVVNAFQSQGQGSFDAFVTKLNPAGNAPVYSTFLGGNDSDEGFGIAVDGAGNAYVTGRTFSARGFPTMNAFQSQGQGSFDAFVTKLSPGGNALVYSTFLGGGDSDEGYAITVDGAGNAYITGRTFSARGFPVRNAIQSQGQGSFDAFVTKLNPGAAGAASLVYSTFLGGGDDEVGCGIAVDGMNNAYVTGRTFSARGFPAKDGVQSEGQGSFDAFVTKVNPTPPTCTSGTVGRITVDCQESLLYSTFLGGGDSDEGYGIAVDAAGSAYVTGRTFSAQGFPTTMNNAFQSQGQGSFDVFISKLTDVPPVANDLCSQATNVTRLPFTEMLDTRAATTSPDDPPQSCSSAGAAKNSNSVWYRFTPSQNGTVTVSTVGSNYDTILTVYTGACGSLREAACNDDFGSGVESQITFDVTAGTTYLIEVTDFDDRPGAGMLVFNLRFTPR